MVFSHIFALLTFGTGVEAGRAAISTEVNNVFSMYGISVDKRHLGLIADYMVKQNI